MNTMKALLCMLFLAWVAPAMAAVAVPASVEDLARESDAVVRGKVARTTARWSKSGRRIFTFAEVDVASVLRGSAPARTTVVVPGGVVDGIGQRVDGMATFSEGEEVVLFLNRTDGPEYRVRGLGQGKFSVSKGEARPDLSGITFERRPSLRASERRAEPMAVVELERRVRAVR